MIGRTIVKLRYMTPSELEREGWDTITGVPVIELDDGTILYPSQDEEGNGPGALFGVEPDGKTIMVLP